jgi:hypothetical protein
MSSSDPRVYPRPKKDWTIIFENFGTLDNRVFITALLGNASREVAWYTRVNVLVRSTRLLTRQLMRDN